MSFGSFDSRLTGRSLALGLLDGHDGVPAAQADDGPDLGASMVPDSYRTVRSVFWSGGSRHPAGPSGIAVREDCLDGGL